MPNGTPTTMFEKGLEAVKQLGVPTVVAGVLLWFMVTKLDDALTRSDASLTKVDTMLVNLEHLMEEGRATQLETRQIQLDGAQARSEIRDLLGKMRTDQQELRPKVLEWLARGCPPTPPAP
jgi:hypothetical protein